MGINVVSSLFSSIVSVILALLGFSYWSLVYGSLAAAPLRVILYWYASSWRPKISFNIKVAKEMFGFGGWVMFINFLTFFMYKTDSFFIGKFLNASSLGIYDMGANLGKIGSDQIARVMNSVLFPTFSSIQNDKEKIQNAYFKALKYTNLLTIPISLGTIAIAPEFVLFVLGEKWIEVILPIQIFAVYGLFFSIMIPSSNVFLAVGKAKLKAKLMATHLILILIFIYPFLLWWGIVGVALCIMLSMVIMSLIALIIVSSILDMRFYKSIKVLREPTIASIIMFFSVMIAKILIGSSLHTLFIFIFIGILTYFTIFYIVDKGIFIEFNEILSTFRK
ncbi:putative oligosaccharide flippase [groundwater metagenome]|uniref:Putative oligosaccharide flippase n=1 Tax=groundwater metagenome TaxID=717931 RepID=A0A098EEH9_9ZZZZ